MELPIIPENPYVPYKLKKCKPNKRHHIPWYVESLSKEEFIKTYGYSRIGEQKQVFTAIFDAMCFNQMIQGYHALFLNMHTSDNQFFDHKWVNWHSKYTHFYKLIKPLLQTGQPVFITGVAKFSVYKHDQDSVDKHKKYLSSIVNLKLLGTLRSLTTLEYSRK